MAGASGHDGSCLGVALHPRPMQLIGQAEVEPYRPKLEVTVLSTPSGSLLFD